jgi:hypothetical protein
LQFVSKISEYTFDGDDLYAIESSSIQSVFTAAELAEFRQKWRDELIPKLSDIRRNWQLNRDYQLQPDEQMQPLLDSLEALKIEFAGEPTIIDTVDKEIKNAQAWVAEELAESDTPQSRPSRVFGEVDGHEQPPAQARSIFDDIDE